MQLLRRHVLAFLVWVIVPTLGLAQGYIELNPANTITPNSGTYYVGCFNSYGQLLPSCCPSVFQGVYTYSGGHNHAPGPRASLTQGSACYSNYEGVRLDIRTSTAGQAELIRLCGSLCSDWILFSQYAQFNTYYLQQLSAGANYELQGATGSHASNHFGTRYVTLAIPAIANEYAASPNGHSIGINDISLVYGGVFDIAGTWAENNHQNHRMGLNVDVQYRVDMTGLSIRDLSTFQQICANYSGNAAIHNAGTGNQHLHVTFLDIY